MAGATPIEADAGSNVCPHYQHAVELIGRRWTGSIVQALMGGPMRFSEIADAIPALSDRLLSTRLKELEANGIVTREVLGGAPVQVRYGLTGKGRALEPVIAALRGWARDWLEPTN